MNLTAKENMILQFLYIETFSKISVLQFLLQHGSIQATYQLMGRMIRKGLLTKHKLSVLDDRPITLYGITTKGIGLAFIVEKGFVNRPAFQKSKVSIATLQHKLDLQLLHIKALFQGATDWVDGSQLGSRGAERKVPDAIVRFGVNYYAIEVERNIKSVRRIRDVIRNHLLAIKEEKYKHVVYACPTQAIANRLKCIWESIDYVNHYGVRHQITNAHRQKFTFIEYSNFNLRELFNEH